MTGEEKRMERPEKYRDGRKDHHQGGGSKKGIPVLYQQFERKYRTVQPCGKRPLECREHALAFGCDI